MRGHLLKASNSVRIPIYAARANFDPSVRSRPDNQASLQEPPTLTDSVPELSIPAQTMRNTAVVTRRRIRILY